MKKIFNVKNIGLLLIVVLITVLTTSTKEAKAAGTVTWNGPSSITIRETIKNIAGPITAHRDYFLADEPFDAVVGGPTATINYTASDTPTNYQITKSTTMNLSSLTFSKPGDYEYYLNFYFLQDSSYRDLWEYIDLDLDTSGIYKVTVSVRNVVDANNTPTGNFTATMILYSCEYNEQTDAFENCSKVNPVSGNLIAETYFKTWAKSFGYIEISKTVNGIGADTTKYFPFTININSDANTNNSYPLNSSGWTYPISGIDSTITYNGNAINNPTTITVGTPTTIYLKHGQTAVIGQITNGVTEFDLIPYGYCDRRVAEEQTAYNYSKLQTAKKLATADNATCYGSYYTIEENPGDYTPYIVVNGGENNGDNQGNAEVAPDFNQSGTSYDYSKTPKFKRLMSAPTLLPEGFSVEGYYVGATGVGVGTNTVDYVNTKEMSPVTGIILTILPYLVLIGISIGMPLLIMYLRRNKKVNQ